MEKQTLLRQWLIGFAVILLSQTQVFAQDQGEAPQILAKFRNTHYYVALEHEYQDAVKDVPILDMQDRVLVVVGKKFRSALYMEGSGRLLDGRVLNYDGKKNDTIRWAFTVHPYGRGVGNCALVPFRTIAVDRTRIALGSQVFIDETVGMKLPDGTIHDGFWKAEDVGSAIQRDRVDLFVGDGNQGHVLRAAGIGHLMPLTVRVVAPPAQDSCVHQTPQ